MAKELIKINKADNVAVATRQLNLGGIVNLDGERITVTSDIAKGHKVALHDIKKGEDVIKYGITIGKANKDIRTGELVHFNIDELEQVYPPFDEKKIKAKISSLISLTDFSSTPSIRCYKRADGEYGIRNYLWAVLTDDYYRDIEGIFNFHESDLDRIALIRKNPNCGAMIIISDGDRKKALEEMFASDERVSVFSPDEDIEEERERLSDLLADEEKTYCKLSEISFAIRSDNPENRTAVVANTFLARCSEVIVQFGGKIMFTETIKMLNSASELLERCIDKDVYDKALALFKEHEPERRTENSKRLFFSGLSNVREVSAGNVWTIGDNVIAGVLREGERMTHPGIFLCDSPEGDGAIIEAVCSGASLIFAPNDNEKKILSPVPVVSIASDPENVMTDFNASDILEEEMEFIIDEFFHYLVSIANGRSLTDNEKIL